VLDVVTGSPGSFTEVACNDDFGGTVQSQVTFTANAGTTYFFMIGGFDNSQAGTTAFHLSVTGAAPPNDNFANAINASPSPFTDVEDTTAATVESTDPNPSCAPGSRFNTIWYKFTPPGFGTINADTHGSDFDTILVVVTGSPGSFIEVACNDDTSSFDLTSQISFSAVSGTTYFFMVGGFGPPSTSSGSAVFHLSFTPAPPAVTLSPSPVAFGNQVVGVASTPRTVTLTNSGSLTLNIISIAVTGTNAGDFALSATGTTPCPFGPSSLAAGSSCTFNVTFTPGAAQPRSANVTVISNAPTSPDNDPLSGTGFVDFTVAAAAPSTQTVTAGGTGTFTINVATVGGTLPNPITLTASGLPPASTGSFNPASFAAGSNGGSSTFTVTTTKGSAVPPLSAPPPPRPLVLLWLLAGLLVLAALLLLRQGIRARRLALYLPLVLLLLSAAVVVGCGGGGGIPAGTPPGTYNISITATSGSATHTTTVTLIVN